MFILFTAEPRPMMRSKESSSRTGRSQAGSSADPAAIVTPRSRYPIDLGHNFVLAHAACNGSKADYLAAQDHLSHWLDRNLVYRDELVHRFNEVGVVHDVTASVRIAEWAYSQRGARGRARVGSGA